MGTTRLLLKQKLVYSFYIFLLILGCDSKMVNYKDFVVKPIAIKNDDFIKIKQGSTAASAAWIKSEIRFEQDKLFISGKLTLLEQPTVLSIKLPDPSKEYRVYWVDEDSQKSEIAVGGKDRISTLHIYGMFIEDGNNKSINKVMISFHYKTDQQMEVGTIGSSGRDGRFDFTFEQWWGFGDPTYKTKSNESFKLIFRKEGYEEKAITYELDKLPLSGNITEIAIDKVLLMPKAIRGVLGIGKQ